ncbi:AMP-binding protein [Pseudonocardia sp. RS010]|uniref:AMP-binding protein n=1 Tax=Pseudonocardia sp. RS010 TaxID=3385979 RepID=UPI0039A1879D
MERRLLRGTGPDLGPLATRFHGEERTVLHVLEAQAADRPDADWLVFDGRDRLTFAGARDAGLRVAAALAARGLAGSRVALLLRNQLEFMPVFLGALASCGVAAPMNPELRGQLLGILLGRCDPQVLAVRVDLLPRLAELRDLGGVRLVIACGAGDLPDTMHGVPVLGLDALVDGVPAERPPVRPRPSDLAVLMFTSGTSGGSKAAMWPHHYLYLASAMASDALGHTPDDVLSTPLQMCHIAGLQVFANSALHVGCTAHLKSAFSARNWWTEVAEDGATFAMLMGQMTAMILHAVPEAPEHRLHTLYVLPQPADRFEFERRYGTTVVWQGWGMTEIFPHLPRRERLEGVSADTIGPAPAWVDHGVVDTDDRMLGPGELGELVYRPLLPDAMARGYFGDAETTADAFRNFMFHTGDLGFYDERGHVHFVMRNQDSIRRRGENISAVELENVTRTHPAVVDAAAYAVSAELGEHEVKLDVVLRGEPDLDALHAWLREQLPRYMVPRYLEARPDLPRTPSQRVEKYKLAADGLDRPQVREFDLRRR